MDAAVAYIFDRTNPHMSNKSHVAQQSATP